MHDFVKLLLIETLITVHNFDIVYLSETLSNTTATHSD